MKIRILAAAFTTAVTSVNSFALTVSDGDFSSWVPFSFVTDDPAIPEAGPNTSSGTGNRVTSGGNPGAYFEVNHTFTTGDRVITGGIKNDFEYDPSVEGPLQSFAVAASLIHPPRGSSAWQLVIEQDGRNYYSFPISEFETTSRWVRVKQTNLSARNFDTNPLAGFGGVIPDGNIPNLTSTGGRIRFGFAFGNRVTGGNETITHELGLDNFLVTTSVTPTASIAATQPAGAEGGESPQFTIAIDAIQRQATVITYKIGGSAKGGADYKKLRGRARIKAGATSVTITLAVKDDAIPEETESVSLKLKAAPGYTIDSSSKAAKVEITDND